MYRNVLVPLDGSPRAEGALLLAAHIARDAGATLTLLRVPATGPGIGHFEPPAVIMELYNRQHERVEGYLEAVAARPELQDLTVNTVAEEGSPASTILNAAYTYDADLIVMASHRRSGMPHMLFGSVAEQIVRRTAIPVIVLRDDDQPSYADGQPLTIVVGLDGTALSESALEPAFALAKAWQAFGLASLKLVRVVPFDPVPPTAVQSYLTTVAERLQASHPEADVPISCALVLDDEIVGSLLNVVSSLSAQPGGSKTLTMIAVATHGRRGSDSLPAGQRGRVAAARQQAAPAARASLRHRTPDHTVRASRLRFRVSDEHPP